jgi:large subunit ribosomal protein L13
MKTKVIKAKEIVRVWHLIDLKDEVLGRQASKIAQLLIGKQKPNYTPNLDGGDYVVVINAKDLVLTRNKANTKLYRHHTGFPGGFREIPFKKMMENSPIKVVEKAVVGMLPKNKLRDLRLKRLKVFVDSNHPYQDKFKKD